MTPNQFLSHWESDHTPFCPTGMAILYRLVEADESIASYLPTIHKTAKGLPFEDTVLWQTLMYHAADCEFCTKD